MGIVRRVAGAGRKVIESIVKSGRIESKVGFFPSAHEVNGVPTAQVAEWMEYGVPSRSIPARPTARPAADANAANWKKVAEYGARRVAEGKETVFESMERIGVVAAGDWREEIINKYDPPLSPLTMMIRKYKKEHGQDVKIGGALVGQLAGELADMEARGESPNFAGVSSKPLNDTGAMLAQLTHITEKK